jgi:catechol 2,3-dioxygenase
MSKKIEKRGIAGRRRDVLGVHSLDSFSVAVPDLSVAERFYRDFGLGVRTEGGGLGLYTQGSEHRCASIIEGPRKRLRHLSFGIFEEDLAGIMRRLRRLGIPRVDPPTGSESNGVWIRDHEGTPIEIRVADRTSPASKPIAKPIRVPPGVGAAPKRSQAGYVHPKRLSHLLLFTADVSAAIDFYSRALGLRLSDRSGSDIAFMHAVHGSDHHVVAFARSQGSGIHHSSWAVDSVHQIGLGASRMAEKGHAAGWGVGRHVLGSNYFYYVRDPWGSYAEYSCDIDYVPVDIDWQAGDHAAEDAFYVWGPQPPADFVTNYELV